MSKVNMPRRCLCCHNCLASEGAKQPPVYQQQGQAASKRKGQPHNTVAFQSKRAAAWRRLSLYTYFFLSLCKTLVEADRSCCTSAYLLANVYVTTCLVCALQCADTRTAACSAQCAAAAVAAVAATTARTATSSRRRTPTTAAACSAQCAAAAAHSWLKGQKRPGKAGKAWKDRKAH